MPAYTDSSHISCADNKKNICVGVKFNAGNRAIPFSGPVIDNMEWYDICIPPERIRRSIWLWLEKTFTDSGTQRIALSSKLFVMDLKISLAMWTPTDAYCMYGGNLLSKCGTSITDKGTTKKKRKKKRII